MSDIIHNTSNFEQSNWFLTTIPDLRTCYVLVSIWCWSWRQLAQSGSKNLPLDKPLLQVHSVNSHPRRTQLCRLLPPDTSYHRAFIILKNPQQCNLLNSRHLHQFSHLKESRLWPAHRSFSDAGPRVWNALSQELWQDTSFGRFWRKLKSHLFV